MLCKHPPIQEKVVQEVKLATEATNQLSVEAFVEKLTEATLDRMQYVHAALTETLRLYPAVPMDEDDLLPDGYKINIGDGISYMPYAMGRMTLSGERMLSNSALKDGLKMVFFLAESPYKFTAFQGLLFSATRLGLGLLNKEFGYTQMKIVAATLVFFFKFKLVDESAEATYRTMFTLHMDKGLPLYAFPRHN